MLRSEAVIRAFILVLALPASALAQDRVIGLLTLPEVFGNAPCAPFEPRVVTLHAEPGGAQVASVHVDQNWSFAPHGGCEGLQVSVHRGDARTELPTREYDYEAPAAVVVEQRGLWFRIRLTGGATAWVEVPKKADLLPFYDSRNPLLTGFEKREQVLFSRRFRLHGLTISTRSSAQPVRSKYSTRSLRRPPRMGVSSTTDSCTSQRSITSLSST